MGATINKKAKTVVEAVKIVFQLWRKLRYIKKSDSYEDSEFGLNWNNELVIKRSGREFHITTRFEK